ncbi:terminase small subunit [Bacillus thuringiensis]|uniref:terminase small subunit n=1 Tax=Bacillus thuringiensis TaxID=1428 RepID=UPI001CFAE3D8|nr:terminase small subunit [Bacillus thuringiensis]
MPKEKQTKNTPDLRTKPLNKQEQEQVDTMLVPPEYSAMNPRHILFVHYLLETGLNLSQSCKKVGYSPTYGQILTQREDVRGLYTHFIQSRSFASVASIEEVMETMTQAMRGELKDTVVIPSGQVVEKPIGARERIKAIEMLAKHYKILSDGRFALEINGGSEVVIDIEIIENEANEVIDVTPIEELDFVNAVTQK